MKNILLAFVLILALSTTANAVEVPLSTPLTYTVNVITVEGNYSPSADDQNYVMLSVFYQAEISLAGHDDIEYPSVRFDLNAAQIKVYKTEVCAVFGMEYTTQNYKSLTLAQLEQGVIGVAMQKFLTGMKQVSE